MNVMLTYMRLTKHIHVLSGIESKRFEYSPVPTVFQPTQQERKLSLGQSFSVTLPFCQIAKTKSVDRLVGTVPQTGVLMVTHERNMRSKFR